MIERPKDSTPRKGDAGEALSLDALKNYRNIESNWEDWGTFSVKLSPDADKTNIPAAYQLDGDTLRFSGMVRSPYSNNGARIVMSTEGLENKINLNQGDVIWIAKVDDGGAKPVWVNDEYRPKSE